MKKIISLLLALILLFSLSACSSTKGVDARLIFPIDRDPLFLDPQIISDTGAKNIILNTFEGLVTLGEKGEILPGMAEKWDVSSDGKTYVFYLRQDSRWRVTAAAKRVLGDDEIQLYPTYNEKGKLNPIEEGKDVFNITVTAHDFVFGLRRALRPETKCPTAYKLYAITNARAINEGLMPESDLGVSALDDHTLKITLENNDPDFLYTLLEPSCMPCNEIFFEKTGGRYGLATRYLIYNGPFYINNWADDSSVSIRKNADYYYDAKNVMPYSVYFSINDEQDTRLRKLKNETYDITPFNEMQAASIEGSRSYRFDSFDSAMYSLIFNCKDTYLSNIDVRRAIASGFNFNLIQADFNKDTAQHVFPSAMTIGTEPFGQLTKKFTAYTATDAKATLRKGLNAIDKSKAEIVLLCKTADEIFARKLIQNWQASLGVILNVSVEITDENTLRTRIKKGEYQLALGEISYGGNSPQDAALRFTSDSRDNISGYSSTGYDEVVKAIAQADGGVAKAKAIEKAESYLSGAAVVLPIYEVKSYVAYGKGISGIIYNRTGDVLYFRNVLEE
ncbi:MAG: peptide ABC transporter substrate-binding protein [Clostridia bacterium]|nr:peptide ABC transporter substrate-binding protein [Clostridia bacterium]